MLQSTAACHVMASCFVSARGRVLYISVIFHYNSYPSPGKFPFQRQSVGFESTPVRTLDYRFLRRVKGNLGSNSCFGEVHVQLDALGEAAATPAPAAQPAAAVCPARRQARACAGSQSALTCTSTSAGSRDPAQGGRPAREREARDFWNRVVLQAAVGGPGHVPPKLQNQSFIAKRTDYFIANW